MRALILQSLLAVVWPTGPSIKIDQGLVATIHECRVGVGVDSDQAVISAWRDGSIEQTQVVRKGQLLVACGVIYRLYEVLHERDSDWPSRRGTAVILDLSSPRRPLLHRDSVVLTLSGDVRHVGPHDALLKELSFARTRRGLSARFTVTIGEAATSVAGVAGDLIAIGPARYRIAAILPPDPKTGVPGWVELVPAPRR
jgi:hypothetical protein